MPPPKKVDPPHKLTFATNSVRNTTFALDNDKFYYEIVTRFWHPHLTKINKYDYENRVVTCVAEIESFPKKEVKVRFNTPDAEGEWIRASDFVKCDGGSVCVQYSIRRPAARSYIPIAVVYLLQARTVKCTAGRRTSVTYRFVFYWSARQPGLISQAPACQG